MRIDDWPLERIMRLPDWCFGRRFGIFVRARSLDEAPAWDISEVKLPDVCVVWEVTSWRSKIDQQVVSFRLAIGSRLPTSVAIMSANEPLFNGLGAQGPGPRTIDPPQYDGVILRRLRMPLAAQGKRLILEVISAAAQNGIMQVCMVVSSIPREVPDWLISAQAISL